MQQANTPLPLRSDTLLGVCQALGEDFGFNPYILRVLLSLMMAWQPLPTVAAYLALGVLVLLSRLLVPAERVVSPAAADQTVEASKAAPESLPELAQAA